MLEKYSKEEAQSPCRSDEMKKPIRHILDEMDIKIGTLEKSCLVLVEGLDIILAPQAEKVLEKEGAVPDLPGYSTLAMTLKENNSRLEFLISRLRYIHKTLEI